MKTLTQRVALLAFLLTLTMASGCGTGTYNERMKVSMAQAGRRGQFDQVLHGAMTAVNGAGDAAATGISLRIPKLFDDKSQSLPATNNRSNPPQGPLPGLSYAMERMLDDQAGKFAPAYCYIGAVSKASIKPEDLQKQIAARFGGAFQPVSVESPQGAGKSVLLLSALGAQDFDGAQSQLPVQKLEGQIDIYLIDSPNFVGIVAFRAPKDQAAKYQLFQNARMALGTFEAAAAAPPAPAAPAAPAAGGAAPAAAAPGGAAPAPAAGAPAVNP